MKKFKRVLFVTLIILGIFIVLFASASIYLEYTLSQPCGEQAILSEWNLILVNNHYHIPKGYDVKLMELSNGQKIDERIYPELQEMFDDMRSEGVYPFVREGYRTADEQKAILREFIGDYMDQGYSLTKAYELTRKAAAAVGNSEHQLGIAVDINADLDKCEAWDVYNWLDANAWKYGFILRYPPDKTDITETNYEPWHYRYVGKEAAEEIHSRGVCLEEYLNLSAA